jgi:hypothetical protein
MLVAFEYKKEAREGRRPQDLIPPLIGAQK